MQAKATKDLRKHPIEMKRKEIKELLHCEDLFDLHVCINKMTLGIILAATSMVVSQSTLLGCQEDLFLIYTHVNH